MTSDLRDGHAVWCCVEHPGTHCGDQCPACGGPLDIDNEACACGYDASSPRSSTEGRSERWSIERSWLTAALPAVGRTIDGDAIAAELGLVLVPDDNPMPPRFHLFGAPHRQGRKHD